mmetsp:Transcript_61538/g.146818  ORF Transcript_61538/g.146818 Transcript_61538/m.146818 type:complete len:111 (-) Transcript_61538:49-381(-)
MPRHVGAARSPSLRASSGGHLCSSAAEDQVYISTTRSYVRRGGAGALRLLQELARAQIGRRRVVLMKQRATLCTYTCTCYHLHMMHFYFKAHAAIGRALATKHPLLIAHS